MNWKKWLGLAAVVALVGFIIYSVTSSNQSGDEVPQVRTEAIQRSSISESVSTQGEIVPVNQQEVVGSGIVTEVNVAVGDQVSEGDVLADYMELGEITAQFDGTVTELNIDAEAPDTNAQMGNPSIVLESLDQLQVDLELSQGDVGQVSVDDPVSLDYQGQEFTGFIESIAPSARPSEDAGNPMMSGESGGNTLKTSVAFDEDQDLDDLIAGFEIDLEIEVSESEDALLLPIEALNFDEDGQAFVFTVVDNQANKVMIETGLQSDLFIEVAEVTEGDLSEGDAVILSPDENLQDGDEVEIEDSEEDSDGEDDNEADEEVDEENDNEAEEESDDNAEEDQNE